MAQRGEPAPSAMLAEESAARPGWPVLPILERLAPVPLLPAAFARAAALQSVLPVRR